MRSVSIGVRDAILNGKRPFIKALVTYRDGFSEWLYDDDFMQNSVQFQNGTSSKGNFEIGAAVIGAFSFSLNNWDHKFDTRNFDGAIISAFIGINPKMFGYALLTEVSEIFTLNDGEVVLETEEAAEQDYSDTTEWFQFGQYYFVKHKSVGNVIVCDAYDAMKLFDESLLTDNSIVYPISAKNLVRTIADHNGITLKNYDFPNGDTVISEAPEDDCTERQMLAYVCQMIGCFARINSTGQLDINWYDDIPATTIMHRFSHSLATEDITITGLRMSYKDADDQDASSLFLYRKPYKGVLITFDERSATEASYDRVVIYYKSGNSYKMSSRFTGNGASNNIAGKTFYIPSNEFWVYWHTDTSSDAFWGWAFTVTPATTVKSETVSTASSLPAYDIEDLPSDYYPQSEHDGHYGHRIDKVWHCKASYYIDTTKDSGQWIPMSGIEADNTDYVLEISGNPLINASNYEDIEELLADKLIGLTFRHGDMSILANPSFEAGDVVTTFDDKGNRALFLITNIDYSLTVQQTISCDAQEIEKSDLRSIKSTTVARREAKSVIRNEMTAYDAQYMRLTQLMTQSLGFFETKETTPSGGYIYYMHNNPDLHESSIIWKMTENTFTVSTDGGQTWNAGITADGNALVNVLSAKGINADWLNTGSIIVQKNGQTVFLADYDTGVVRIVADEFSLSSGDTIQSIANSAAATAKTEAIQQSTENLNTFINGAYATTISGIESDVSGLQTQIDGKIDTYFMSGTPSASTLPESEWTTDAERDKHIDDLYYDVENNLSYRYTKVTGTRITFDSQSETRDYTMDWVEIYYRVDGQLYRVKRPGTNSGQFGGRGTANYIAGISVFIPTYDFYIYWRAATSSNYYGFSLHTELTNGEISERWTATGLPSDGGTPIELAQGVLPETNHNPYEDGYKIWHVTLNSPSNGYKWIKIEDADAIQALANASTAQDTADGKRRVFVTQPVPPYDIGDLWAQGTNGDILKCKTAKSSSGSYNANDWEKASNYVDEVTAKNYTVQQMTQTEVFNKLTNNGEVQGVFLQDGQLYINADYIQSGIFTSKKLSDYYVEIDGHYAHQLNILKVGGAEIEFSYSDPEEESTTFGGVTARFEVLQNGDFWGVGAKKSYFGRCETASYSHRTSFTGMEVGYAPLYHFGDVAFYGNRFSFYKDVSIGDSVTSLKTYVDFYDNSGTLIANFSTDVDANDAMFSSLVVGGTKSRIASTKDYSDRLLYCYETPSPLFGDVGEGTIGDDGNCYVWIDSIFAETVTLDQYQVFLQKYGDGDCFVKERKSSYFVVSGTPGMTFGWELKAKQSDFDQRRLEKFTKDKVNLSTDNYGAMAEAHLAEIKKERGESND